MHGILKQIMLPGAWLLGVIHQKTMIQTEQGKAGERNKCYLSICY